MHVTVDPLGRQKYCIPKGKSLLILFDFVQSNTYTYIFHQRTDDEKYAPWKTKELDAVSINGKELCLLIGISYTQIAPNNIQYDVYITFLSDLITVQDSEIVFMNLEYNEYEYKISWDCMNAATSIFPKIIFNSESKTKKCYDFTKEDSISFDLNEDHFSVKLNGYLKIVFLRSYSSSGKNKEIVNFTEFKCKKQSLILSNINLNLIV